MLDARAAWYLCYPGLPHSPLEAPAHEMSLDLTVLESVKLASQFLTS
jgi:hypothetical protein